MSVMTKDVVAKYKLNLVKSDCCREDVLRIDFAIEYIDSLVAAIDTVIAQNGLTLLAKEQLLKARAGAV